jgi:hypothetical protein
MDSGAAMTSDRESLDAKPNAAPLLAVGIAVGTGDTNGEDKFSV